ncbi:MAG TPA: hypothetical protein VL326_20795 [Kofleriaceae bacterium]|nr:hypothetical protein [Kofleriaceae bacterium]
MGYRRVLALAAVAGCSIPPTLSDLPDKQLRVAAFVHHPGNTTFEVELAYGTEYGCYELPLDSMTATVGGTTIYALDENRRFEPVDECYFYFAKNVMPTDGEIVVTDLEDEQEVRATFDPGVLERRFATHADWIFRPGEPAEIQWSHPADLVGADVTASVFFVGTGATHPMAASITAPDLVTFTLPVGYTLAPDTIAEIEIVGGRGPDAALTCTNAVSCTAVQNRDASHAAMIVAP